MDEAYLKDLGKTVPSMEGEWSSRKEFERLSIVYVIDEDDYNGINDNGDGGNNNQQNNNNNQNNNNQNNNNNNNNNNGEVSTCTISIINNQGATIIINGDTGSTKVVNKGIDVEIIVTKEGYKNKVITLNNVQNDYSNIVEFTDDDRIKFTITVTSNKENSTIKINERITTTLQVNYGEDATIKVKARGYVEKTQTLTNIQEDKLIEVIFTEEDAVPEYTITVNITGDYDICLINNTNAITYEASEGEDVTIVVKKQGYIDKEDIILGIHQNEIVNVEFTNDDIDWVILYCTSNVDLQCKAGPKQNQYSFSFDYFQNNLWRDYGIINNNTIYVEVPRGSVGVFRCFPQTYVEKDLPFEASEDENTIYFEYTEADRNRTSNNIQLVKWGNIPDDIDVVVGYQGTNQSVLWNGTVGKKQTFGIEGGTNMFVSFTRNGVTETRNYIVNSDLTINY